VAVCPVRAVIMRPVALQVAARTAEERLLKEKYKTQENREQAKS